MSLYLPHRPWQIWAVVALTLVACIMLVPLDHIPQRSVRVMAFFAALCFLMLSGFYTGARWAFVVSILTLWIFPYETWRGIKPPVAGSILCLMHLSSVLLLLSCWRYIWTQPTPPAS